MNGRSITGQIAHHTGVAAEHQVARHYLRAGLQIVARRWRGRGGEIDLIARSDRGYVFIEVKASRDLARAALALSARQMRRLTMAAEEFVAGLSEGFGAELRFDVALVDRQGRVDILENASFDF